MTKTPVFAGLLSIPLVLCSCGGGSSSTASSATASVPRTGTTTPSATQGAVPVESNPPGDIPDSVAYVTYSNASGRYRFVHPEGWTENETGTAVTFSDKLNGVAATTRSVGAPPTTTTAQADVQALRGSQPAFELRSVKPVTLPAGTGVLIVYRRNSAPDAVTGRQYRDEVQRFEVASGGREVDLELSGPVGSDNVDPYAKISQSLAIG